MVNGSVEQVLTRPDDRIIVIGSGGLAGASWIRQLLPSGAPDPSFGGGDGLLSLTLPAGAGAGGGTFIDGSLLLDGRLMLFGYSGSSEDVDSGDLRLVVARLLTDGSFDSSFSNDGVTWTTAADAEDSYDFLIVDPTSGRSGIETIRGAQTSLHAYTASGMTDTNFAEDGTLEVDLARDELGSANPDKFSASASIIDWETTPDGSWWLAGLSSSFRLNCTSQGADVTICQRPRFVSRHERLYRFTANGTPDTTFGAAGRLVEALPTWMAPSEENFGDWLSLPDGSHLLVTDDGGSVVAIERRRTDGTLDPTYGDHGRQRLRLRSPGGDLFLLAATIDPLGRLVLAAGPDSYFDEGIMLRRLTPSGAPDTSFDTDDSWLPIRPGVTGSRFGPVLATDSRSRVIWGATWRQGIDIGAASRGFVGVLRGGDGPPRVSSLSLRASGHCGASRAHPCLVPERRRIVVRGQLAPASGQAGRAILVDVSLSCGEDDLFSRKQIVTRATATGRFSVSVRIGGTPLGFYRVTARVAAHDEWTDAAQTRFYRTRKGCRR